MGIILRLIGFIPTFIFAVLPVLFIGYIVITLISLTINNIIELILPKIHDKLSFIPFLVFIVLGGIILSYVIESIPSPGKAGPSGYYYKFRKYNP